ncbi:DUF5818 domain-containing protein [Nocardioides oleivorans]|uniref:DUF5818 domain-containing protein n=1 Tax=Nocardioides oleivorans TaxID=273676 RepID=UPI0013EB3800|nr:DUF5818 domain-containing protein [Nocardioides oleivorans]
MSHRAVLALASAALVMLTAGCGSDEGPERAAEPATPTSSATTPSSSSSTTTPPSEGLQKTRIVGEVVEDGDCVVVRDDNATTWTIAGDGAADLVVGDRVAVTGAPDLAATGCGGPLVRATSIRALP